MWNEKSGCEKNLKVLKYFLQTMETKVFFQFEIIINVLVLLFPLHLNTYVMGLWQLWILNISESFFISDIGTSAQIMCILSRRKNSITIDS